MQSNKEKIINYNDKNNKCNLISKEKEYILYLYFGISSTSLLNDLNDNITYNLYFGKNIHKYKILDKSITFTLITKTTNFLNSSLEVNNNNNYIYDINDNKNNYLFLFFGAGKPIFYDTPIDLDKYLYIDNIENQSENQSQNQTIYKPRYNELITLLTKIKSFLESNKYKKIILGGHSNGIVVATFLAYILLILSVDDDTLSTLPKHHNVNKFLTNINKYILENNTINSKNITELSGKISKDILNFKSLKDIIQNNIYICGSAGVPILWTKVEEFNIFNEFYKNKYIHIVSAFNKHNTQIYDTMTYYNKFQYMYEKAQNILKDININNKDKKLEIQKLYDVKNINYTYYNFNTIVFNLINYNKLTCFLLDTIFDKLKYIDMYETKTNINYVNMHLDKHHSFGFYRILYNIYMNNNY